LTFSGLFFQTGLLDEFLKNMDISGIELAVLLGLIAVGVYVVANG
jgi:hypothetical protein